MWLSTETAEDEGPTIPVGPSSVRAPSALAYTKQSSQAAGSTSLGGGLWTPDCRHSTSADGARQL
jgi:hypothetical protein